MSQFSKRLEKAFSEPDRRGMDWVIPFGMYKGQKLRDLIEVVPRYVEWLTTDEIVKLDAEANDALMESLMVFQERFDTTDINSPGYPLPGNS
jgi:hypothetical protein